MRNMTWVYGYYFSDPTVSAKALKSAKISKNHYKNSIFLYHTILVRTLKFKFIEIRAKRNHVKL